MVEDPVRPSFFDPEGNSHHGIEALSAFADIGTFAPVLEDGTLADTDPIAVYRVNDDGLLVSMAAHWAMARTMATLRKAE